MGRIYCIMGKSASGKDSVYRELRKAMPELGTYVMYTTRPMRQGEVPGVTYHYITEEEIGRLRAAGKLIESRTYDTVYGPWTYATVDDGQLDAEDTGYLMPATLESYRKLKDYFGADRVVPLYIEVDNGERLLRAVKREMLEQKPKYSELCRRFLADEEDFSEEKLREAGITSAFRNEVLDACVKEIADVIRKTEE